MNTNNEKNKNTMNNTNESKKARRKDASMEIETIYKCVCPNGTRKTIRGHINGIATRIEKVIRSGRWDTHLPQLFAQIKENKESLPWSAIDWFMDDLCGGKFPIEPTNNIRYYILFLVLYVNKAIRFGEEEANACLDEVYNSIVQNKEAA